ncbi:MAG TPA: peptide ABC transporter substrate-binding protein, partial [Candidatus Limnocylindrales bacterium]|nr:peptide ABC transporter substrate-binding protein [Candidatus Limnocylindrales bacterium]
GSDEISIINSIQRGLLYLDGELNVVPMMATAMPEVSEDGTVYTFTLGDWSYSDGTPIVAGDFVRAAQHLADPRNAFDYGYEMCWVAGVNATLGVDFGCSDGETPYVDPAGCAETGSEEACAFDDATIDALLQEIGVTAPDEHTVVFTLTQPTSFWNNIVAMWLLTPVPEGQTSWAEAADIKASGPFMVSEWTHNATMTLVPNPEWNGTQPTLQRIEMSLAGDPAAAVAAFERGDLDQVGVPSSDVRRVLADPALAELASRRTNLSIEYYDFANCPDKATCPTNAGVGEGARIPGGSPSQNANFRKALAQAVDLVELKEVGFAGLGEPAYSPTMPGIPGFPTLTADNAPTSFDVTAALASMATALDELDVAQPDQAAIDLLTVEGTCDATCAATKARVQLLAPIKFGYNCDAGHDQRVLYLANVWRTNLGFSGQQMDIRCTDFGTFRTERRAGNVYDIARNGWGADFPHPDNQNRDLFACGAGNNNSKYCNEEYDALLNQGATAGSYDEALPFYQQAETMLADDQPVLFLRYGEGVSLIQPWVSGLTITVSDSQNRGDRFPETIQILAH